MVYNPILSVFLPQFLVDFFGIVFDNILVNSPCIAAKLCLCGNFDIKVH